MRASRPTSEARFSALLSAPSRNGAAAPAGDAQGEQVFVLSAGEHGLAGEERAGEIRHAVASGATLVVFATAPLREPLEQSSPWHWLDLGSIGPGEPLAAAEWFLKPDPTHPGCRRLPQEIGTFGPMLVWAAGAGPWEPLCTASVGFVDRPALLRRRVGDGTVLLCGLAPEVAEETPALVKLLSRLGRALPPEPAAVGLAVVGYGPFGGMGLHHGLAAQATDGLEFVATCDPDPARRKRAEQDFPGIRSYTSLADLASDQDVSVVVVATPPNSHVPIATELLRAGKHVACEKPLSLRVSEADALIEEATRAGVALTVNQNRRWDPDFLAIRRAVELGALGELFNMETFVGGFEHPCRAWHSEESISGGAAYDWGSHHLDWVLQLMGGAPSLVIATQHKRVWHDVTNADQIRVRLHWPDGREAEFLQSDVAAFRRPKFFLQGTEGSLVGHYRPLTFESIEPGHGYLRRTAHHAEAPATLLLGRYEPGYGITETSLPPVTPPPHAFHANLADHLLLGEELAVTAESVREVVGVLEAAAISAAAGGRPQAPTSMEAGSGR